MSHYAVAVITSDLDNINNMLESYNENIEVEPYIRKSFREILCEYKDKNNLNHLEDADINLENVKRWAIDWHGGTMDEEGNLLSRYNPLSKWDWYEVGGRWSGFITTNSGKKVDYAKIKDINFLAGKNDEEHIKQLTEEWNKTMNNESFYKPEYYIKKYKDLQGFIDNCTTFSTYSVLDANGWHEPGRMGWFGCSGASPEEEGEWTKNYYDRFIKDADPEMYLVIVDCHI